MNPAMTDGEIRKRILTALFRDQRLCEMLVLKGGNALSLVYQIGDRTSLDLDFSIESDFEDLAGVSSRIEAAITAEFASLEILVFDFAMRPRPKLSNDPWWGGYSAEFKLIEAATADRLGHQRDHMRRQSLSIGPGSQRRKYSVEISKYEFVDDQIEHTVDGVTVRVYTPALLAAEKLRALVQQHPDYPQISRETKRSRARDLYDIWTIADYFALRIEAHFATVQAVFEAKRVPFGLLGRFRELRAIHSVTWPDVENSVGHRIREFDYYFDYVRTIADSLYAQWNPDSP